MSTLQELLDRLLAQHARAHADADREKFRIASLNRPADRVLARASSERALDLAAKLRLDIQAVRDKMAAFKSAQPPARFVLDEEMCEGTDDQLSFDLGMKP